MYFFTADEHYNHKNVVDYCNRPFHDLHEMNKELIARHNEAVKDGDIVIHAGDFCFSNKEKAEMIISKLNGHHIFLQGDHDRWLPRGNQIWQKKIEGQYVVVCHYALHTWPRSHYNSWHLYAHSHKDLNLPGKRICISVDATDFYPLSFEQIKLRMGARPDNPNFIKRRNKK